MTLAQRIARMEAVPDKVPLPNWRDPHAMQLFAEALVRADRLEGQRRFAEVVWAMRGRPDLADAANKGDVTAIESAITTATDEEREQVRVAAEVLLRVLQEETLSPRL